MKHKISQSKSKYSENRKINFQFQFLIEMLSLILEFRRLEY